MPKTCEHGSKGCPGVGDKHYCADDYVVGFKDGFIAKEKWLELRDFIKALAESSDAEPNDALRCLRYMNRIEERDE